MRKVNCIICKRKLEILYESGNPESSVVDSGGTCRISCGYGSGRFDLQLYENYRKNISNKKQRLIGTIWIAYICDDCIAQNLDNIETYNKKVTKTWKRRQ